MNWWYIRTFAAELEGWLSVAQVLLPATADPRGFDAFEQFSTWKGEFPMWRLVHDVADGDTIVAVASDSGRVIAKATAGGQVFIPSGYAGREARWERLPDDQDKHLPRLVARLKDRPSKFEAPVFGELKPQQRSALDDAPPPPKPAPPPPPPIVATKPPDPAPPPLTKITSTCLVITGPAGCGKSFAAARHALELVSDESRRADHAQVNERFRELCDEGRLDVCVFHAETTYASFVLGALSRIAERAGLEYLEFAADEERGSDAARVDQGLQRFLDDSTTDERATVFHVDADVNDYVLVIEGLERADPGLVFGDVLPMLAPERRLGRPEELMTRHADHAHRFGLPPNLHIVATMRPGAQAAHVAALHRFRIITLAPRPEWVEAAATQRGDAALGALARGALASMNARIAALAGDDHRLGHGLFMHLDSLEALRDLLIERVVPALTATFEGQMDRVAAVLGAPWRAHDDGVTLVRANEAPIMRAERVRSPLTGDLVAALHFTLEPAFATAHGEALTPFLRGLIGAGW